MSIATPTITVVSRPGCVQCNATIRSLDKAGVKYVVETDEASERYRLAMSLGHQQAPVVLVQDAAAGALLAHWSGFRPDLLAGLAPGVITAA